MAIYTVSIYWDQKKKEIWYMIIDEQGNYRKKGEPSSFDIGKDSSRWQALSDSAFEEIFKKIEEIKKKNEVNIKYKIVNNIAPVIPRRSYISVGKDSTTVDKSLQKYLKQYKFIEGKNCFYKRTKLKGEELKLFKNLLKEHKKKFDSAAHRLWCTALHETNFEQLYKKALMLFNNLTRLNQKGRTVEQKRNIEDYLQRLEKVLQNRK